MANAGSRGERISEGAERVRKDRAKVNKQVMKLEEATISPILKGAGHGHWEGKKGLRLHLNDCLE